jgi:peptidoglycan/xylan/chitin deacetylase (PgdA/CDA1 family)
LLRLFETLASYALRQRAVASFARRQQRVTFISLAFHRFACSSNAATGHDLDVLDENLRWLSRVGYTFGELESSVRNLVRGRSPDKATVIVTIDDGYHDVLSAIPVFARHGCPVTVFLATEFLDTRTPLWWDQVQLLLARAPGAIALDGVAGITWAARWSADEERIRHGEALIELIKRRPEPARQTVIAALAASVSSDGAVLPFGETPGYTPLRWDDVRALEREGIRFGAHSHTHPILSAVSDEQAKSEIETSWARLRAEVRAPVPIFAYPDGTPWSYSRREADLLRTSGIEAAVTMNAKWIPPALSPPDPYQIGRIAYASEQPALQLSVLRLGAGR